MLFFHFLGNPLICDCQLLWYKQWLQQKLKTHEALREVSLKTHCWTRKKLNHEYSISKVSQLQKSVCFYSILNP